MSKVTRRAVLSGTAAASVAAIASAHGVATAAPAAAAGGDLGCGLGNLDGAVASFVKMNDAFHVVMKWGGGSAADVFYKPQSPGGGVDVFFKFFSKGFLNGWSDFSTVSLNRLGTLNGAEASFAKVNMDGAAFFIKGGNTSVVTTFVSSEEGVQMSVDEISSDGEIG